MIPASEHRHCKVCGKTCDPDEDTCSDACQKERARRLQNRRNTTYLIYGLAALLLIVYLAHFF